MNKIPASVFILCIVYLQEFCYKFGYTDYSIVSDLLIDACNFDGSEITSCEAHLEEIRTKEPFLALDISQETFVYSTFKNLKSGI